MNVFAKHAESLKSVQRYHGAACPQFTWNDTNYPILPGSLRTNKSLGPGGFRLQADLRFVAVAADLPDPGPALGHTIIYNGKVLRIDVVQPLAGATLVMFECNDAAQGA